MPEYDTSTPILTLSHSTRGRNGYRKILFRAQRQHRELVWNCSVRDPNANIAGLEVRVGIKSILWVSDELCRYLVDKYPLEVCRARLVVFKE